MSLRPRPKILIIKASDAGFSGLESSFGDKSLELLVADSLGSASALTANHDFALALLESDESRGIDHEKLKQLRQAFKDAATPLVLITSERLSRDEEIKAYDAGAADILTKPIVPEVLRSKVRLFIDLHAARVQASQDLQSQLAMSEARLSAILESAPAGILFVNHVGELEYMNQVGQELWGGFQRATRPSDYDAYRGFWPDTGVALDATEWACAIAFKTGEKIKPRRVRILTFDGKEKFITAAANPIRGANGEIFGSVGINQDITELVKAEHELRESEAKFRTITDVMPQMVWSTTADGFHDYYNKRWYDFTGVSEGTTDGEGWSEIVHPEDQEKTWKMWRHSLATGEGYEVEYRLRHHSGDYKWTLGRALPVRNAEGTIIRWMGTCTDIHEQKRAAENLAAAKAEAEHANQLKSDFLANMSHEIRTPLGAMLGFADLLKDPGLTNNERSNFVDILSRNGEQLAVIINDILDLSKVEAGHLALEYRDLHPNQLAEEVLSLLRVKAKEKDLVLEYKSSGTVPRSIVSDPTRVRQVLLNLVSNAVKFTKHGSVTITSYGCKTDDGRDAACFEIADTGIGFPEAKKDFIFQAFVQADTSMTRRFGGTGLGLALSRQLARAMGGDITVLRTKENVGTTFLFKVEDQPSKRDERAETANEIKKSKEDLPLNALAGVRILVVDDAPDNQALIWRFLTKYGAIVDSAENGFLGYRKAIASDYDVILMDLQMPIMDGYTATHKLRSAGFSKPIIALTAHAMNEVRQKCLNVGCSSHLPKPINPRDLVSTVRNLHVGNVSS